MNSMCVFICDRHVSCPQANSAVQWVCWPGKQPGEPPTHLPRNPTSKNLFKSKPTLSLSVFLHQVVEFDWLQLPLMALYFARRLARRYMSWSTWKEVVRRLLDWVINRPLACSSRHQHPCQNRLCRSNDVAGWNPARSGRRPTFPRLSTRRRKNLNPLPLKKSTSTDTLFCHQGLRILKFMTSVWMQSWMKKGVESVQPKVYSNLQNFIWAGDLSSLILIFFLKVLKKNYWHRGQFDTRTIWNHLQNRTIWNHGPKILEDIIHSYWIYSANNWEICVAWRVWNIHWNWIYAANNSRIFVSWL